MSPGRRPPPDKADSQRLAELIQAPSADIESLKDAARHPALSEELALALLRRRDVSHLVIAELAHNQRLMKLRKVRAAVVAHQRTPRHVSLPQIRHMFTFDLLQVALMPHVASDLKMAIEELLLNRLTTLASGERLSLARRGSTRIAAELLGDEEPRIVAAALDNQRLSESWVVKALLNPTASKELMVDVCNHPKWSLAKDVRAALLRSRHTPLAFAISFSESFTLRELTDILRQSRFSGEHKDYLLKLAEMRQQKVRR